ncbi:MAG: calcium-binding protein [Actinomycetota bacterium]|nr:calcium-binding protein [Actinomycetota bacterium]
MAAVLGGSAAFAAIGAISPTRAEADVAADIEKICDGLETFSDTLEALDGFEELGQAIPLSKITPGGADGLKLVDTIGNLLKERVDGADCPTTLQALEDKLKAAPGTGGTPTLPAGINVTYGDVSVQENATNSNIIDVEFPVDVSRQVSLPISYTSESNKIDLGGGGFNAELSLSADFHFTFDRTLTGAAQERAFGVEPTTIDLDISADAGQAEFTTFTANLGFTDVTVSGQAIFDLPIDIILKDPDTPTDNKIDKADWTSAETSIGDLVEVRIDPGTTAPTCTGADCGEFDVKLGLDTGLIPGDLGGSLMDGNQDAILRFHSADLRNFQLPIPSFSPSNLGSLGDFRNIKPEEAISAITQMLQSILASSGAGDYKIPFTNFRLSEAFSVIESLQDFITHQVVCGTQDNGADAPSGDTKGLSTGDDVFCQGVSPQAAKSGTVTWTSATASEGANTSGTDADDTVGTDAADSAEFEMTQNGDFQVSLAFTDVDTDSGGPDQERAQTASVTPKTIQALFNRLTQAPFNFNNLASNIQYDTATSALTFRFAKTFDPAAKSSGNLDFGDQLASATHMIGLSPTGGASASADVDDVDLDATLGILLRPDVTEIEPGDNSDPEFAPGLIDRFFMKAGTSAPLINVGDVSANVTGNLKGKIGFVEVTASGSGTGGKIVDVGDTDDDADTPVLSVALEGGTIQQGAAGGTDDVANAILIRKLLADPVGSIDATCDLAASGGLNVSASAGGNELASGGVAISWDPVVDADTCLPDTDNLTVTPNANFTDGLKKLGEMFPDNPEQLLDLILNNLDSIVEQIESLTGTAFLDQELPMIGVTPRELVNNFKELKRSVDELRGAATAPTIVCGTGEGTGSGDGPPTGGASPVPGGSTIYCQATTTRPVSAAQWSIEGGTAGANATSTDTIAADPTKSAAFTIGGTGDKVLGDDFRVVLEYTDEDGNHMAEMPSASPPQSLQKLEDAIELKLGLPDNALGLDIRNAPQPDGTPGPNDLVIELGYGICTDDNDNVSTNENNVIGACASTDTAAPKQQLPIKLDLGDLTGLSGLGGLVGLESNSSFQVEYAARAQLDLAIPLSSTPVPNILDSSGLELKAGVHSQDLNLSANLGPLDLKVGSTVEIASGTASTDGDGSSLTDNDGDDFTVAPHDVPVGATLKNTSNNETCKIGTVAARVLTCASGQSISFATDAPYKVLGAGVAKFGAEFSLKNEGSSATDEESFTIPNFISGLDADLDGINSNDCGPIGSPAVSLTGDVCARLSLSAEDEYVGDLGLRIEQIEAGLDDPTTPAQFYVATSPALVSRLQNAILNWSLLLDAIEELLVKVEENLDGTAKGIKIPLVGDALDGGAKVAKTLREDVIAPLQNIADTLETFDEAGEIQSGIQDFIWGVGPIQNLLQDGPDPGTDVTKRDIAVTVLCGENVCGSSTNVTSISDARVTMAIGQGLGTSGTGEPTFGCGPDCTAGLDVPFDLGIPGLPFKITGMLHPDASWKLLVDFGLNRTDGPYLVGEGQDGVTGQHEADPEPDDGDPDTEEGLITDAPVLKDTSKNFTTGADKVDPGSFLINTSNSNAFCIITDVNATTLSCDDSSTGGTTEGPAGGWDDENNYQVVSLHEPDGNDGAELNVGAGVSLGASAGNCGPEASGSGGPPPGLSGYSASRCLKAELGFLEVALRDGDTASDPDKEPTELKLGAQMDITANTDDGKIGFADLGDAGIDFGVRAEANVDVRFRTGIKGDQSGGFPSVMGTFHLEFGVGAGSGATNDPSNPDALSQLNFKNIHLDAGAFITQYLEPIATEVKRLTGPLQPVIDTLRAPIPVVSDLSKLVGGPPITMIGLMEAVSGQDLSLVKSVIAFLDFVNNMPSDSGLIPLGPAGAGGSFGIDKTKAIAGPVTPNQPDLQGNVAQNPLITGAQAGSSVLGEIQGASEDPPGDRPGTFGVPGLTFPFIENPAQIFGVLMGNDAVLVRYDAGTLRATAGFSMSFGPITIGPVPVTITIGGSVEVRGRFVIGYDTSGLRKFLSGASPLALFDGIFLDDLDAAGNDVPEITLIGTVYAGAAVDLVIVSVGVEGGIELTVDLNLDDRPNADGRLHIEEIINKLSNPICLFDVRGKLEAFLRAFIEIDLFFYTKKFSIELFRITLLEFEGSCSPPKPKLSKEAGGNLVLLMGSSALRTERNIATEVINENFIVRRIEGTRRVAISAFGVYEEKAVPSGGKIVADAGDGNDQVAFQDGAANSKAGNTPGETASGDVIDFDIPVQVTGGTGNDAVVVSNSSGAVANVSGGANNDKIQTGDAGDTVNGDANDDVLDTGAGNDTVTGGTESDDIKGGPGGDTIDAGAGDDTVTGGPGLAPTGTPTSQRDGDDTIVGGTGNDTLEGGYASDKIFGDEDLRVSGEDHTHLNTCEKDGASGGLDSVDGGDGDDFLFGGANTDRVVGGLGADRLCGNAGDDQGQSGFGVVDGGDGDDYVDGGSGNDLMFGRAGHDQMFGDSGTGNDTMWGGTGPDDMQGGPGNDLMNGEAGNDIMVGDEATIGSHNAAHTDVTPTTVSGLSTDGLDSVAARPNCATATGTTTNNADCVNGGDGADFLYGAGGPDVVNGDSAVESAGSNDYMEGNDGPDLMRGFAGNDIMKGGNQADDMFGDSGTDTMDGDAGIDTMRGGIDSDTMRGGTENDVMNGDAARDFMFGNANNDTMHGDAGDDYMFGNENDDSIYGDLGQDELVGGSNTAAPSDGTDTINGGDGTNNLSSDFDVIAGDNATIERRNSGGNHTENAAQWLTDNFGAGVDGVFRRTVTLLSAETGVADTLNGEAGYDRMFGQGGGDTMNGNGGDDYMEGNADSDTMNGNDGQDDMVGGTDTAPTADAGDTMHGNAERDVLAGDNAVITRPLKVDGTWDVDQVTAGVKRGLTLHNANVGGDQSFSGADQMFGDSEGDKLYGQGENDTQNGNDGDDYLEGNQDSDTMSGNAGQDDLIGGNDGAGLPDANDTMYGDAATTASGDGQDVMAGDNASIVRHPTAPGTLEVDQITAGHRRTVTLQDKATAGDTSANGADEMRGNAERDRIYGEGANDTMFGNGADDYMEGNQDDDTMRGNEAQDDMIGGNHEPGLPDGSDTMNGDEDVDVMQGDNAKVARQHTTGAAAGVLDSDPVTGGWLRLITRYDRSANGNHAFSGGDLMFGDDGNDRMSGQGENDRMKGNNNDDFMQGNQDRDWIEGNRDQDDIVGGNTEAGLPDFGDYLYGGAGEDVIAGDNAEIARRIDGAGAPLAVEPGNTSPYFDDSDGFTVITNRLELDMQREVTLNDLGTFNAAHSGPDQIFGGQAEDFAFGQDRDDWVFGNTEADYMEGNGATDRLYGDRARGSVTLPTAVAGLPGTESAEAELFGPTGTEGQDDQIGGSSLPGHRDALDWVHGDGEADFQHGDNGPLTREFSGASAWRMYSDANGATVFRMSSRDTGFAAADGKSGDDNMFGDNGDDSQWAQDGDDRVYGGTDNDDQYGELGNDKMYGELGEDAMLGDRGVIVNDRLTAAQQGSGEDPAPMTITVNSPAFVTYTGFKTGSLLRQVDQQVSAATDSDAQNGAISNDGITMGGEDLMRGGDGNDSMHGGFGNDLMNGDNHGDILFGDDGSDAMWGGKGDPNSTVSSVPKDRIAVNDGNTDFLFGGHKGATNNSGDQSGSQGVIHEGADVLDFRPRNGQDGINSPAEWFNATTGNQHHQGFDWIYGGFDRDVLEADLSGNGPNPGDRLMDWNGAYNLYTACNSAYGGYNNVRTHSPAMQSFLQRLAFSLGAGMAQPEALTTGTSAFRELALVYPGDAGNMGQAYPTTPGHFDQTACSSADSGLGEDPDAGGVVDDGSTNPADEEEAAPASSGDPTLEPSPEPSTEGIVEPEASPSGTP